MTRRITRRMGEAAPVQPTSSEPQPRRVPGYWALLVRYRLSNFARAEGSLGHVRISRTRGDVLLVTDATGAVVKRFRATISLDEPRGAPRTLHGDYYRRCAAALLQPL